MFNNIERVGIYSVANIFSKDFGWVFREQPINDFGIDGHVEITTKGPNLRDLIPTGKLIAVQIKSGKSFFKEFKNECFVFRGSIKHLEYWLNQTLPIILILYNVETKSAYWQEIDGSKVTYTKKAFKINIPKVNLLNWKSKEGLTNIAYFRNKYDYKLWQLSSSMNEIKVLIENRLFLYIEIDGIPYSDNYYVTLVLTDEDCEGYMELIYNYCDKNPHRFEHNFIIQNNKSLKEAINDTLPWARLSLEGVTFFDEMLTEQISREILEFDQDDFFQDVLELKANNSFLQLACYLSGSSCFRLELSANNLAHNFLALNEFLIKEPIVKQRIFI
jgi:hypothetical protein